MIFNSHTGFYVIYLIIQYPRSYPPSHSQPLRHWARSGCGALRATPCSACTPHCLGPVQPELVAIHLQYMYVVHVSCIYLYAWHRCIYMYTVRYVPVRIMDGYSVHGDIPCASCVCIDRVTSSGTGTCRYDGNGCNEFKGCTSACQPPPPYIIYMYRVGDANGDLPANSSRARGVLRQVVHLAVTESSREFRSCTTPTPCTHASSYRLTYMYCTAH